ncbi:hypothetical protein [Edwardsiella tarda]
MWLTGRAPPRLARQRLCRLRCRHLAMIDMLSASVVMTAMRRPLDGADPLPSTGSVGR